MRLPPLTALLCAGLLTGCSAGLILENVSEMDIPRNCVEVTKLFNTFSMQATAISWNGPKNDGTATLTVDLSFENDKKWPVALSNSGNGILYTVEFTLNGEKSSAHRPKQAAGLALSIEPKKLKEAPSVPLFRRYRQTAQPGRTTTTTDELLDVNYRIKPNERQHAKLVFEVPRDNYLLVIERKFEGKPVQRVPTDHLAACKISGGENVVRPARRPGISGVY